MTVRKLNTALIGLTEKGLVILDAASKSGHFHIQAVADLNTELAQKTAEAHKCAFYDDYRQLVIQNQFDALFVTAPSHSCAEHIQMAMRKKTNILKLAPLAPNFEQAARLAQLARDEKIKFGLFTGRRFSGSFRALQRYLRENQSEKVHLITGFCAVPGRDRLGWPSDPGLAGGGVLLYPCYEMIDQIVSNFSIPERVYSLNLNQAPDKTQRLYLTEDTAIVTMKFTDELIGSLVTSEVFGPYQQVLEVHLRGRSLIAAENSFTVCDNAGTILEQLRYNDSEESMMIQLLENFAMSILSPENSRLCCAVEASLGPMAFIEAAYLSARTGMPEEPARILEMG